MPVWTQGEQQKTELLQGEAGKGEGASPFPPSEIRPLPVPAGTPDEGGGGDAPPSKFRPPSQLQQFNGNPPRIAGMPGEGGTHILLSLDHPPSCNNSTEFPHAQRECQAKEGEGTRLLLILDLSLSQRKYQLKEGGGGGTRLLPDLDHPPGSSSSQENPAHHPGGQLA